MVQEIRYNKKKARAANYYNKATPITVINEIATSNKLRSNNFPLC